MVETSLEAVALCGASLLSDAFAPVPSPSERGFLNSSPQAEPSVQISCTGLPCPGCTHLLDGIDGAARHMGRRAALHIVAKSSIARLAAWAHERGWDHLSLVSTTGNNYDADYFGDTSKFPKGLRAQHRVPDGENWDETIFNVFKKNDGAIRHF